MPPLSGIVSMDWAAVREFGSFAVLIVTNLTLLSALIVVVWRLLQMVERAMSRLEGLLSALPPPHGPVVDPHPPESPKA